MHKFLTCLTISLVTGLLWTKEATCTVIHSALYINQGDFVTVDTLIFPYYAFNKTASFSPTNQVIQIHVKDTLLLKVINTDSREHKFSVKGVQGSFPAIQPGDTGTYQLVFDKPGAYIYHDAQNFPKYSYMGLAGLINVVESENGRFYYWNIKEHQMSYNRMLYNDSAVDWKQYEPDYFTINGLSYPHLQDDDSAVIKGKVGDTIYIVMANTGQSAHSIHFHGYHTYTLTSSDERIAGWDKDTYNVLSFMTLVVRLVPDKPGLYPVHDHNLVALSGGGRYPNGMLILMDITE